MIKSLIRWHAKNHKSFSRHVFLSAQLYRDTYIAANNYSPDTNGEYRLLDALQIIRPKVIFDVGANIGEYSKACIARFDSAISVFAFEPSPSTFVQLSDNLKGCEKAILVKSGLSDSNGSLPFNHCDDNPSLSGLGGLPHGVSTREINVPVQRGDAFAEEHDIRDIDLLKIDVEGFEIEVLRGFSEILGNIQIIQFEYNEMSWIRGRFLLDFMHILPGFDFGRLTNGGVLWDLSLLSNSHFCTGNMVAVNQKLFCRNQSLKRLLSKF